ncbi:hypothetical protein [Streptomyces alkaliterrae]|uniref:Uncharacterized protein n=1 Tax=Streptomyces alkaliterrae TaxID=2213162 RepID=A0A7W3ZQ67_9ACTN|nr:hypothetical protein [Streptomyces alkaliterrae]MBB1256704.1 hypothetical protein [Streptomyces alkaliterrae]MBB1259023.1 hypothetical protein [Streptomyces alkaliterrae]
MSDDTPRDWRDNLTWDVFCVGAGLTFTLSATDAVLKAVCAAYTAA